LKEGDHSVMADAIELFRLLEQKRPVAIGFHMPAWISHFVSLSSNVAVFIRGQAKTPEGRKALKNFQNNHAAEPWKETIISSTEENILKAKVDLPPQTVPQEAIALTCGVDVQKIGFWFAVRAWAMDYTSWLIHYGNLGLWEDVEQLLFETIYPVMDSDRSMRILRAAIDTGGGKKHENMSMTEETYHWLRKNQQGRGCRCFGTKGASRALASKLQVGKPIDKTPSGKPLKGGLQIISVDTHQMKDIYHWRLDQAIERDVQAAYLHSGTGQDYARQILAEKKQLDDKGGEIWINPHSRPNHLFDAEILAMIAADPEWPGGGIHTLNQKSGRSVGRRVISKGVEQWKPSS